MSSSEEPNVLDIEQLSVNYGKTPVLWDINLKIPKGQMVGILGPNGAGKSTLIKAILQLVPILNGQVLLFSQPLAAVRTKISYVPQRESVDWNFPITVKELVMMGRYGRLGVGRRPSKSDWEAVDHYLHLVDMAAYAHRQISQLSGGQQQRVFIARALIQQAEAYFLDEPFAGIDLATEGGLVSLLQELRQQGKTIFIVHHDLHSVERYFNWVIILNMRLVSCGPTKEAFTPQALLAAYGRDNLLFGEVARLYGTQQGAGR